MAFDQKKFDQICNSIAKGKSLRKICKREGMPSMASVMRWLDDKNESPEAQARREQYARARSNQADYIFDEIQEIADKATVENHAVAKLRTDVRKWRAGKMRPKKYGERMMNEVSGPDGAAIPVQKVVFEIHDPKSNDG